MEGLKADHILDCYGLLCPLPVRKTAQALKEIRAGQILEVIATDEWFGPDLEAWLRHQPHRLLAFHRTGTEYHALLQKRTP
ncbi:MAG: sulfurtransferase TusA family protein [Candidatus Omnitrophica bacterium]|nr:sulfurtransferase TusA family protein [Candidatus Omnitrophota bacterium]